MSHRNIIVIGASAGGVEPLKTLMAALPNGFPAAIFVVLHIPAYIPSELHLILDRVGPLRAAPGIDGEPILPGRIYVASADRHLMLASDRVRVTRGPKENRMRPAVDVLFRSAAAMFGPRVIGMIFSGMLDDGTAGLWAVKDRGGATIVQSDALHPSMPESARQHVKVDYVLPAADTAAVLMNLTREAIPLGERVPVPKWVEIENRVALEGNALQAGVMGLGPVSSNTCPECHGVLVKIQQEPIARYRCHTGHSFSLQTLLSDINDAIDRGLWNTIRAIEERILLLQEMEQQARKRNDLTAAEQCAQQAHNTAQRVQWVREVVLDHGMLGHDPAASSPSKSRYSTFS